MVKGIVGPLNWNVPIVDKEGRPTPEFQQKWREQARVNDSVPDISDAQAVSALLDLIGGTAGDMLRRGATVWEVIAAVGGTDKFLRADGTWAAPPQQEVDESQINLTDVLTNNVSTTRHGFAPKLPNDSTKYLDGTGQWSTPAGGGGGGGGPHVITFEDGTVPAEIVALDTAPFVAEQTDVNLGTTKALRFADIDNGEETAFKIDINPSSDGPVITRTKNSLETNWDYMYVYLDGVEMFTTRGNDSFLGFSFMVAAGSHTVVWKYKKDSSTSLNDDTVYISRIEYPS